MLYKVGDTSLPVERPEMLDDDLLRQLHHVLLEVSQHAFSSISPQSDGVFFLDSHRQWFHDVSKLRPRVSDLEWDPKYGPHLARSPPIATGFSSFYAFSRFSYWQSTRSGSVLALMQQYSSWSCRWFMETQARIIRFYSRRETFSLRDTVHVNPTQGTGIRTRNVLLRRGTLKRSEARVYNSRFPLEQRRDVGLVL
jgi:hypothetical protein